jgi:predicted DNA binding CopG/RHH family protein
MKLTRFEKEIKNAMDRGDFKILRLTKKEKDKYVEAARLTLAKDKIVTIRMNGLDLAGIKEIAVKSGKRYQTYIGELLHEHVQKRLKVA